MLWSVANNSELREILLWRAISKGAYFSFLARQKGVFLKSDFHNIIYSFINVIIYN